MIRIDKTKTTMTFGSGDIGVNSGSINKTGIIVFHNQSARPVGTPGDIKAGTIVDLEKFEGVIMEFNKVESIDVVIEALLEAKEAMKEGEDE